MTTQRRLLAAACLLAVATPLRAAQPQFWRVEGARDFLDGDLEGLSVDSEGRVRLAPALRTLHDPEAPYVWSLAVDGKGTVYAGTGNDGKVFRITDEKASLLFDATELEVHALALGPDGKLYAGTSPDGKVYAIDADGKAESFYDPTDKYIWALVFDAEGNLFVATGSEARVHRVDRKGSGQVVLTSPEVHILSLARDARQSLYAGSAPGGIVYRIDASLRVSVVQDSAYREVKSLGVGDDGSVYAALVESKDEGARPAPATPPSPAPVAGEVIVSEAFAVLPSPGAPASPIPRVDQTSRAGPGKGAVARILPSGEVDLLWSSTEEAPHALLVGEDGILVGTGNRGKVYRIREDRTWAMVSTFPGDQVTALARGSKGVTLLATSNPGKVHALDTTLSARGTFTSKVKDTDTVSSWGRVRWDALLPKGTELQVQTRAGNTSAPDTTWSEWSPPYLGTEGAPVASERARFIQVRASLIGHEGTSPVLDGVVLAFLQRNLRPTLHSLTVHPAGEVFQKPLSVTGEVEILGLEPGEGPELRQGAPIPRPSPGPTTPFARRLFQKGLQTLTWRAEDPNGDAMSYEVHYRPAHEGRWRVLRKGLSDPVLTWDTSTVPSGRYVVKVVASDAPGNPQALALSGEKESVPFDVDNTPPSVSATLAERKPARVRALVRDDASMIRKAEFSMDGGRWQEVHPLDGINDSSEETYEVSPGEPSGPGPHVLVVRATDLLGNTATARVELP
jgi:WD40 repeat protein